MATFIGDYACKVDAKGRIILPAAFKKQMPSDAQDHFVVKKDMFENCLVLYAIEDWNSQLDKIRKKMNSFNREHNIFLRNYFIKAGYRDGFHGFVAAMLASYYEFVRNVKLWEKHAKSSSA